MLMRVGIGYDVHQLAEGRKLILGGIEIPHEKGIVAHSDGDVLIHAICDALLGAANLRDIGFHFPDNSATYKNISSVILLEQTVKILKEKGYLVGNIDSTICLQRPKIKDVIPQMVECLAKAMQTDPGNVSVKATTTEKLGFVGEEKGISVYAVALIYKET
ncbi:MAG: 2-C-methyl-D-erythritol 2,4-cyclodiphosphate synthase [Bacteroidales bacterium]|nr:2-C-methyl-D-erythritol 2,4-cyclodiphosphate synthase [Bacteroidales bacterium]